MSANWPIFHFYIDLFFYLRYYFCIKFQVLHRFFMQNNIHKILNTSTITNIAMPRMWCKGAGCIAHDVGEITTAYFHEQMTDFRIFMSEDVSDEDIDKGWNSLCFQYESLAEDPQKNGVYDRFFALAMECSMRKRIASYDNNPLMAQSIVRNMLHRLC